MDRRTNDTTTFLGTPSLQKGVTTWALYPGDDDCARRLSAATSVLEKTDSDAGKISERPEDEVTGM